jgi:hypothetical protein
MKANSVIIDLAWKAGLINDNNESHVLTMERIGGNGIITNLEGLTRFAKIVGQMAREDEKRKVNQN